MKFNSIGLLQRETS